MIPSIPNYLAAKEQKNRHAQSWTCSKEAAPRQELCRAARCCASPFWPGAASFFWQIPAGFQEMGLNRANLRKTGNITFSGPFQVQAKGKLSALTQTRPTCSKTAHKEKQQWNTAHVTERLHLSFQQCIPCMRQEIRRQENKSLPSTPAAAPHPHACPGRPPALLLWLRSAGRENAPRPLPQPSRRRLCIWGFSNERSMAL